ncbi:MAG: peptidase M28, partial [Planctomycetia bacterium]|nr:peptidase M28 [Planctomycetia bacterium]
MNGLRAWVAWLALAGTASVVSAADPDADAAARIKADVAVLASDRFEGRGPGTRGEELTTDFLSAGFAKAGLAPAGTRGTFLQPVPLYKITTDSKATLAAAKGDQRLNFVIEEEFAGIVHTQSELETIDAEAVFVGHGIDAPAYDWDDYAGLDVKGKI